MQWIQNLVSVHIIAIFFLIFNSDFWDYWCYTGMYQRLQNTLYPQRWQILRKQFLEACDWFAICNRGKVFNLWYARLKKHKSGYRKNLFSQNLPLLVVKVFLLLMVDHHFVFNQLVSIIIIINIQMWTKFGKLNCIHWNGKWFMKGKKGK